MIQGATCPPLLLMLQAPLQGPNKPAPLPPGGFQAEATPEGAEPGGGGMGKPGGAWEAGVAGGGQSWQKAPRAAGCLPAREQEEGMRAQF